MIKFNVHVMSKVFIDKKAFIEVEYPVLPRVGDIFWLSDEQEKDIKEQIIAAENVHYYRQYVNGTPIDVYSAWEETESVNELVDSIFSFGDVNTVKRVSFMPDGSIHIEVGEEE